MLMTVNVKAKKMQISVKIEALRIDEFIPDASYGDDKTGLFRIITYFLANSTHNHVDTF